ncbi:MAG: PAS domain S-box protein [Verrucomicrobia bacterium]|jgi:two-component system, cell cycle sensor histidine kinase and response regulator CckA|nr:PAS domain S-box protein [Verrucomicrobiota bacterium]MBT7065785.1 PAS domain S-box protein [Verrucomicrobiota bacterium]MBT7699227.1 PAS domain S-box protein [Verrucomicrobiota bacterium]
MKDADKTRAQLIEDLNGLRPKAGELEQINTSLVKENEFTKIILDSQVDTFFVFELATGRVIRWNHAFVNISGYSNEEIAALKAPDSYYSADDLKNAASTIEAVLRDGKGRIELSLICKDGHLVPTEYEVSVLTDDQDVPIHLVSIGRDITERKKAEEELRESEASYRTLAKNLPGIVYRVMLREDGRMVFFNETLRAITGFSPGDLSRGDVCSIEPLIIDEDRHMVTSTVKRAISENTLFNVSYRLIHRNGETVYVEEFGRIVNGADGKPQYIDGVIMDITERKRAAEELREARNQAERDEEYYHTILNNMGDPVLVKDEESRLLLVNDAFCEMFDLSRADIIGRTLAEDVTPEERAHFLEIDRQVILTGQDNVTEESLTVRDLETRIVSTRKSRFTDSRGSRFLVGVIRDMTHRKKAEEVLQEKESWLQGFFDNAAIGIAIADPTGHFLQVNEHYQDMFGYTNREELFKKTVGELTHSDDRPSTREAQQMLASGKVPFIQLEKRYLRKDGTFFWSHASVVPIRDADGRITAFVAILQDITERRQMEEHLRQSEKMEAIGQIAGGVAHDFNNQLGGIMNFADLLLSKTKDEELHRYIDAIIRSCTRGKDLTGQLLAFSRKGKYQSVPVDIHQTISEVVSILQHSVDRRIAIRQHLDANPATTVGDPTQLQNALLNLGLNARDAMAEGGELVFTTGAVRLDEEHCNKSRSDIAQGDYLKVTVADSGTGMDEATRTKIFEPFFTTKDVGKGTGMGLASVYGTVVNHHGAIEVDSEVGKGTTMTVYLPLSQQEAQEDRATVSAGAAKSSGARILLVDDEKSVRIGTGELLRGRGYKVVTAENGVEAVEYYGKSWQHIDLVIIDMNMPVMNGRDTLIAMREMNPEVKAILATGYSLDANAQEILDEGALSHIQKPYRVDDLVRQMEQALDTIGV